jgi:hypothetical protein
MNLKCCWNVDFLLEPVGTYIYGFYMSVGTKKRFQRHSEGSNKTISIINQCVNL